MNVVVLYSVNNKQSTQSTIYEIEIHSTKKKKKEELVGQWKLQSHAENTKRWIIYKKGLQKYRSNTH